MNSPSGHSPSQRKEQEMMQDLSTRYALFTRLPLLQGISSGELLGWEEALRLDIDELPPSRMPLIRQDDTCTTLLCLVEGELQKEHRSPDGIYVARSLLKAPATIEIDRLFGLTPTYENTYLAKTEVKMLGIRKSLLGSHLMKSEVFRLNLLNTLSACAQKRASSLKPIQTNTAYERLRHFLNLLFHDCEGEVELIIRMRELARYIGETRLTTSRLLNELADEGSIHLCRGHFFIHDIQKLLMSSPHNP